MTENSQEDNNFDKGALFLQAIQERMSQMVVEYEAKIAELRVEFTLVSHERDNLLKAIEERDKQDAVQTPTDEAE
jgi:hypothetical protein